MVLVSRDDDIWKVINDLVWRKPLVALDVVRPAKIKKPEAKADRLFYFGGSDGTRTE